MNPTIKIDIWSDIACPWCYIGKRRLEMAITEYGAKPEALPVEVEYHSFQLAPDIAEDEDLGSQREYLSQRKGIAPAQAEQMMQQVSAVAATVGLHYDMEAVQMTNTFRAHRLLHLARERGLQVQAKERLMAAYFTEGRHLGRVDELVELATEVGLDPAEAREVLEGDGHSEDVRADQGHAMRYGIQGVPFFVFDGKYGISGAQEPAVFLHALTTVQAELLGQPDPRDEVPA